MNTIATHTLRLLLFTLLPLVSHAAPTPYWPGYPPSPYYYPLPPPTSAPASTPVTPAPTPKQEPTPVVVEDTPLTTQNESGKTVAVTAPVVEETPPAPMVPKNSQADNGDSLPASEHIETTPVRVDSSAQPAEVTETITAHAETEATDDYEAVVNEDLDSSFAKEDAEALAQEIAAAIQQGNFAEAYYLWRPLAEAGNAEAQYGIGWMYHNGYGLAIDDDEAIAWWELASIQGHVDATFALGMLYGLGEGAQKRDMGQAVRYYRQAAIGGHEDARLLLRTLMMEQDEDALQLVQTLLTEGREAEISLPATVTSNKANVRRGPSTQHKVLITLSQGHKLLPLKREGRWLLLGIAGKSFTGWIHDSLVGKEILATP